MLHRCVILLPRPSIWLLETYCAVICCIAILLVACADSVECDAWPSCDEEFWRNANTSQVRAELDAGYSVNARTDDGLTPLHIAASLNRDPEVIEVLLDNGGDIEAKGHASLMPLHAAVFNKNPAVIEVLLDNGADIEARAMNGTTPLQAALFSENPAVVDILLDSGADIEEYDDLGKTPLHVAVLSGDPKMLEVLLNRGADIEARDVFGKTPLQYATDPDMIELLRTHGNTR